MKKVNLSEAMFEGVVSFCKGNGWLQPLRLKADEIPLHNDGFVGAASTTSGCRLRFATTSEAVTLSVEPEQGPAMPFDLTSDDRLLSTVVLQPGATEAHFDGLPAGWKTLELWLPIAHVVRIRALLISDDAELKPDPDSRKKWVTYGSSITHCGAAHSPSRIWPAVAARMRGLNITSLGYGGNCHMEPLVAMMIRDLKADFISLKVGINMVSGSVSERTYRPLLTGMVKIIREKHPQTPIAVISPVLSPPREETPGATGMTLRIMRRELELAVERLRSCGDKQVHYFSGADLFPAELLPNYFPDLLHPNGDGYELLGRNFAEKVIDKIIFTRPN